MEKWELDGIRRHKGNPLRWQNIRDPKLEDITCRQFGKAEETGDHVALVCMEREALG